MSSKKKKRTKKRTSRKRFVIQSFDPHDALPANDSPLFRILNRFNPRDREVLESFAIVDQTMRDAEAGDPDAQDAMKEFGIRVRVSDRFGRPVLSDAERARRRKAANERRRFGRRKKKASKSKKRTSKRALAPLIPMKGLRRKKRTKR